MIYSDTLAGLKDQRKTHDELQRYVIGVGSFSSDLAHEDSSRLKGRCWWELHGEDAPRKLGMRLLGQVASDFAIN